MPSFNTLTIDLQCVLELLEPFYPQLSHEARVEVDRLWDGLAELGLCVLNPSIKEAS